MKVYVFQQDIAWGDPETNRSRLDEMLKKVSDAELVVLPEMFSTGFATKPLGVAEHAPCQTLEWMKAKAAEGGCAIAGSVALKEGDTYYNRFYFVKPDGTVTTYNKRHLFTYGGEHLTFTPGYERTVVEWKGVRFLLLVCYDIRFPVWARNRGDYDAIICVANWPDARRYAWDTLVRARAIENQCYMLAANRCGKDPSCRYDGGTVILNPYGEPLAAAPDNTEALISADLDLKMLSDYSAKFPVLEDADNFRLV